MGHPHTSCIYEFLPRYIGFERWFSQGSLAFSQQINIYLDDLMIFILHHYLRLTFSIADVDSGEKCNPLTLSAKFAHNLSECAVELILLLKKTLILSCQANGEWTPLPHVSSEI
jgi:hypothetical protein